MLTRFIEDAYSSSEAAHNSSEDGIAAFRRSTVPLSDDERAVVRQDRFSSGVEPFAVLFGVVPVPSTDTVEYPECQTVTPRPDEHAPSRSPTRTVL